MSAKAPTLPRPAVLPATHDELVIETPERVELYYTRAQVGNRFLAAIVDHLIQIVMMAAIGIVALVFSNLVEDVWERLGQWATAAAILSAFAIYMGYFVLFETLWNGQTPGKRMFQLRVIREDGRPIRFYEAMVRNLLRVALDAQPVVLYSIGIVSVFLSTRSKRIGDYVAGTVVIRESEARAPTLEDVLAVARTEATRTWGRAQPAFAIEPERLTREDVAALRAFLRRRYDLRDDVRYALGNRIAASLAPRLGIPPVALSAEQVLEEVDRQSRRRRDEDVD